MSEPFIDGEYSDGVQEKIYGLVDDKQVLEGFIGREQRNSSMRFQPIRIYAGNNKDFHSLVRDRDANPVDLTGLQNAIMTWKKVKSDVTPAIQKQLTAGASEVELLNPQKGVLIFHLIPSDTDTLEIRQYFYDIKIIMASGTVYTISEGTATLNNPVQI